MARGADYIIVEEPPELPEWMGILDRLRRAANGLITQLRLDCGEFDISKCRLLETG